MLSVSSVNDDHKRLAGSRYASKTYKIHTRAAQNLVAEGKHRGTWASSTLSAACCMALSSMPCSQALSAGASWPAWRCRLSALPPSGSACSAVTSITGSAAASRAGSRCKLSADRLASVCSALCREQCHTSHRLPMAAWRLMCVDVCAKLRKLLQNEPVLIKAMR